MKPIVVFRNFENAPKTSENFPHGCSKFLCYTHYQPGRHERDQNGDKVIEIINMSERSVGRESKTHETVRKRYRIFRSQSIAMQIHEFLKTVEKWYIELKLYTYEFRGRRIAIESDYCTYMFYESNLYHFK